MSSRAWSAMLLPGPARPLTMIRRISHSGRGVVRTSFLSSGHNGQLASAQLLQGIDATHAQNVAARRRLHQYRQVAPRRYIQRHLGDIDVEYAAGFRFRLAGGGLAPALFLYL